MSDILKIRCESPDVRSVFVRCEGERRNVVDFGSAFTLDRGDQVFVLTQDDLILTRVQSVLKDPTEVRTLTLNQSINRAAVFSLSGELVGVMGSDNQLIPLDILLPVFEGLLKTGELTPLAIIGSPSILATDVVVSIDGQQLTSLSLNEHLLDYTTGDQVELTVLRNGKQITMTVILK